MSALGMGYNPGLSPGNSSQFQLLISWHLCFYLYLLPVVYVPTDIFMYFCLAFLNLLLFWRVNDIYILYMRMIERSVHEFAYLNLYLCRNLSRGKNPLKFSIPKQCVIFT